MTVPAQAAIQNSKSASTQSVVKFPADLGDLYMSFRFYDYRTFTDVANVKNKTIDGTVIGPTEPTRSIFSADRENVDARARKSGFASIFLPIPANLVDSFRVEWSAEQLGLVGGLAGEMWQGGQAAYDNILKPIMETGSPAEGAFDQLNATSLKNAMSSNDSTAMHTARRIAARGSPLFGTATDIATGVGENPNLAMLFRGPTLKQHSFSWKLIARSPDESEAIKQIIAIMKRAMHPAKLNPTTSAFLKYPSECITEFHSPVTNNRKFLYPMRPSVLEDMSINYAPNGMPSFYSGTYDTVGVEISVKLQETSYYLRDSFSQSSEYGYDGYSFGEAQGVVDNPTGSDEEEMD